VRFIRSVGEARGYYAVSDDVTAMGRAMGGIISGWGGQDVRLLDLFYRGGDGARLRHGIGPRTQKSTGDALGGHVLWPPPSCFSGFPACRTTSVSAARCSRMPARCGHQWHGCQRAGLAGNTPHCASVGVGLAWVPLGFAGRLRLSVLKQPFDKTQALSPG
jgi:hypothetical protein